MFASGSFSHIELSYVTTVYFNQKTSTTLLQLLQQYASYPPEVLDRLQFVLVDDGSPVTIEIPPTVNLNILLLRVPVDIPWNHAAARNIGVVYARSDRVLVTDVDHEFPLDTLRAMMRLKDLRRTTYMLRRVKVDGTPWKPHSNTFVVSRGRYLELFGYDEEFCGHYGLEDTMFRLWQRYCGMRLRYLPRGYAKVRQIDQEESYHTLVRDRKHNVGVFDRKRQEWEDFGPAEACSRRFLQCPFQVISDTRREAATIERRESPAWLKAWRRWQWSSCRRPPIVWWG